jgi:polysaccharide export outer membrane protein
MLDGGAMRRAALEVAAGLFALILVSACSTKTAPPPSDEGAGAAFASEYRIGIADNLKIDVYRNADLSVAVTVRPDGKITVPVAGDVSVGGKTPEEVSKVVAAALSEYIREPIVTTTVVGMGSNEFPSRVRVTGAVGNPSSIPYRNGMTVLDIILQCGGVNQFASPGKTVLYRANGERLSIHLDRLLEGGDMSTNYAVRPGDIITVPERLF